MESPINGIDKKRLIIILGALSAVLNGAENLINIGIPWLRIGTGNIGIVIALYIMGFPEAIIVGIAKVFVGSLFSGRFMTVFSLFSFTGTLVACTIMGVMKKLFNKWIGVEGISTMGGVSHNITQLLIAYAILGKTKIILYFLPLFVIMGSISGFVVGIFAHVAVKKLKSNLNLRSQQNF